MFQIVPAVDVDKYFNNTKKLHDKIHLSTYTEDFYNVFRLFLIAILM